MIDFASELDQGYRTTFNRLAGRFRSRGLTSDDAADLAQETVTLTISHLQRHGKTREDIAPLINTIAKNLLTERFRSPRRELAIPIDEVALSAKHDVAEDVARRERSLRVRAAIATLPPQQRRAVGMWLEGVSPAEIARTLGVKRNAVDAVLHRARKRLASRLKDCRESVWSAGAFVWARVRTGAHRASSWSACVEVVGPSVGPVLATFAMSALVSLAPGTLGAVRHDRPEPRLERANVIDAPRSTDETGTSRVRSAETHSNGGRRQSDDGTTAGPVRVDLRDHEASVLKDVKNPTTGEEEPVGVEIWHDGDQDRGTVDVMLDRVTETTCDNAPDVCGE